MTEIPHYIGHRERVKQKVLEHGAQSMADYEVLEGLLMGLLPRKDVKPLAKDLISRFGSLSEVLHAPVHKLLEVKGIGENCVFQFKLMLEAFTRASAACFENCDEDVLNDSFVVEEYLRLKIAFSDVEELLVIYLNKSLRVIGKEVLQKGTVDQIVAFPREIVKRCTSRPCTSIIIAHNHPSGDVKPSAQDILITKKIMSALYDLDIRVHEHGIVSKNGYYSFARNGLITQYYLEIQRAKV